MFPHIISRIQEGLDVLAAALNAVKGWSCLFRSSLLRYSLVYLTGLPMPIDVFSVTQKDKRFLSFMSQTVGLFADLDLGTEHLRFLGSK